MPSNQQEAALACCSCGVCVGCCFCEQLLAVNADYVIDAPSCPLLDGQTGNVSGPAPSVDTASVCGSCVDLINNASEYAIPTYAWDDSMPPDCIPQLGADHQFSFYLKCSANTSESETDPLTTENCCRNVRLVITDAAFSQTPKLGTVDIAPLSCSCDPFMAVFPLAGIIAACESFFVGGPCDGLPICAQLGDPTAIPPVVCSVGDATVTFTQSGCP